MSHSFFVVTELHAFIRKVAIDYVRYGYIRYALRQIPSHKNPLLVDEKLIEVYTITRCRITRTRRRKKGLANVVFVRKGHDFILLATEGTHPTFDRLCYRDMRSAPLHFGGYSIGVKDSKPCVLVARRTWKPIEQYFLSIALRSRPEVEVKINTGLKFYSFPGVIRQKLKLVRDINERRRKAHLPRVELTLKTVPNTRKKATTPAMKACRTGLKHR
jgi:hypothetical protein